MASVTPSPDLNKALVYLSNYLLAILLCLICIVPQAYSAKIVQLQITGPIGPATADYIQRGIANAQNADLILILMDTPGGLDAATRSIIQQFLTSKVPILTYVSPNGARAASAGTYLLYASTLAAMAPGTQLGAASPVSLSAGMSGSQSTSNTPTTMEKKIKNDAIATIRSLAQLRGRNPVFAQRAVEEGLSITAAEALKTGVINYIANDKLSLLQQVNGVLVVQNNQKVIINSASPQIEEVNPGLRTEFLSIITNPTVAYLLILLGIYGIFFELLNPGFVLPGVIGAVAMLLALYALQLLPVNYAGLALIVLGIMFIIAEGFTPSFGILGLGGTISFILGSVILMSGDSPYYAIAWSVIWAMAVVNILIFIILLGMVFKTRKQTVKNGLIMLVGAYGRTLGEVNLQGQAIIRGEIWSVRSQLPIAADRRIKVIVTDGLLLEVEEDFNAEILNTALINQGE